MEYECPFCDVWIEIDQFKIHQAIHETLPLDHLLGAHGGMVSPETHQELKRRFEPLGMYRER